MKIKTYLKEYHPTHSFGKPKISVISQSDYINYSKTFNKHMTFGYFNYLKSPLEIAAPLKDFNMKDYELKDFKLSKIEIPDPVVLQPVLFKNKKFYLILSAWGQEASDESVINNKFN